MIRYFAYGSNLDQAQMARRCPEARLVGPAELKGYRLAFTIFAKHRNCGAADIVPDPHASVFGLVYDLSDADAASLDRAEGVSQGSYRRTGVQVIREGKKESAYTYDVVTKHVGLLPSREYLHIIQTAAKEHKFPAEYQAMLDDILLS